VRLSFPLAFSYQVCMTAKRHRARGGSAGILSALSVPVAVAQACWVLARVPRLPEAAGPRAGRLGSGPPLRLLIVGDSSAAGVGVGHQSQALAGRLAADLGDGFEVSWRVLAASGATTASAIAMLDRAAPDACDVAVTALGVNDVKNGVPLPAWLERTGRLHDRLRGPLGAKLVCVSGLPPMDRFPALPRALAGILGARAARFDAALRQRLAGNPDTVHLPFDLDLSPELMAADGFHPGAAIYSEWARRLAAVIRERISG
jgi:lysophospholipase L1-like esterase